MEETITIEELITRRKNLYDLERILENQKIEFWNQYARGEISYEDYLYNIGPISLKICNYEAEARNVEIQILKLYNKNPQMKLEKHV